MTVDDVLRKLSSDGGITVSGLTSVVRPLLHALILGESVRAAGLLRDVADKCMRAKLVDHSSLLNTYADEILATSPGTAKRECPRCEGVGRHGDPVADEWYSDSSHECGQCEGAGKIIGTSPGKVPEPTQPERET